MLNAIKHSLILLLATSPSPHLLISSSPSPPSPPSSPFIPPVSIAPLELNLLDDTTSPNRPITSSDISPTGITPPSLWWTEEQFGGKLVIDWLAYPSDRRVDIIVNRQLWTLLDYIGRYRFANNFGTAAKAYGYNTRIFNPQGVLLAAYTCNFTIQVPACRLDVESSGQSTIKK